MSISVHRAVAIAAVCLALVACSKDRTRRSGVKPLCEGCNVVLISMDTVRADHVGAYGYERSTTPNLDRLAARSILFERAVAQSAWTLPAHGAMMTGLYPGRLGITHYPANRRLPDEPRMLAEELKRAGYATGGFTGGGFVSAHFGFDRGFDVYTTDGRRFEHNLDEALGWVEANARRRFFLFFHGYDAHRPYFSSPASKKALGLATERNLDKRGYCARDRRERPDNLAEIVHYYDASIHNGDAKVGRLLDLIERLGLMERTVILVTSDHGEEFFEHGNCDHVRFLYREVVEVPYALYVPGADPGGRRVAEVVPASISVAPTLLDLVGLDHEMPGPSLEPVARGGRPETDVVFSETDSVAGALGSRGETVAATTGRYKLIEYTEEGSSEAYDLELDPGETSVLPKDSPAYALGRQLRAWHDSVVALPRPPPRQPLGPTKKEAAAAPPAAEPKDDEVHNDEAEAEKLPAELEEHLRALGYLD